MSSLIWCKLPILFSTVELRLGHTFCQFIHKSKIVIFWVLVLGCLWSFLINKEILGFFNVALAGLPNHEKKNKKLGFFELEPRLHFQVFPNSLKSWEIGIFEALLFSYFIRFWGLSFRHSMFAEERGGPILWLNCQLSRKRNVHI